jgi:predicted component of type VI protein secretion system
VSKRKRITWYLVCRIGEESDQAIVWDTLDISAGRRKTMDLVIADPEVSREHAVFRKDGERAIVEDLNTGIGTLVNGERITERELQHGDLITIGRMQIRFGRTEKAIRPGADVRFASELKSGLVVPAKGEGGRTMLAFDAEDELAISRPTEPTSSQHVARAVSADGSLEEVADDPLGLSLDASLLPGSSPGRCPSWPPPHRRASARRRSRPQKPAGARSRGCAARWFSKSTGPRPRSARCSPQSTASRSASAR